VGELDLRGRIILKLILQVLEYENAYWFHMANDKGIEPSGSSKFGNFLTK